MTLPPDDHLAIRMLLEQYCHGADHADGQLVADCFTVDCFLRLNVDPPIEMGGREHVLREYSRPRGFDMCNHSISHLAVSGDDRHAMGTARGLSHYVTLTGDTPKVMVRGVRYDDEYVVEDGSWRIRRRIHQPLWQYQVTPTPTLSPGFRTPDLS